MLERIAVDIGGTFIDVIKIDPKTGETTIEKEHTDPDNLAQNVVRGIEKNDVSLTDVETFVHGTTLGVNALLEREGATVGIITNEGFRDIFELGRYDVPDDRLYDFLYDKPEPLVPRRRRLGVPGRLDTTGSVVEPLDEERVRDAAAELVEGHGVESIVVSFLHSYVDPEHEERAAAIVREAYPEVSISTSSSIVKEHYEYERTSTAVLDAYIKPIFEEYVADLFAGFESQDFDGRLLITRSGGGALPAKRATNYPVHTVLSGPAGGLIGASHVASVTNRDDLITYDMGGTSLETSVIKDGTPTVTYESELDHLPVMIPVFDIRTIGAGGGSIAWNDDSLLKVGPKSAGAVPGPICYGEGGTEPTVTDAAVVLEYIQPGSFLGGNVELDRERAQDGIESAVADPLGMSVEGACEGIFEVTVNKHVSAIREITVEKGLDPRDFSLLAFGGAGPMLAPMVARELGAREVIVPRTPAVFSAWGMLMVDVVHDVSHTRLDLLSATNYESVERAFSDLESEAAETLDADGYGPDARRLHRSLEMRYLGQEQTVDVGADDLTSLEAIREAFESNHRASYGHTLDDPVEIVYQRVRGLGLNEKPTLNRFDDMTITAAEPETTTEMYCFANRDFVPFEIYRRGSLSYEDRIVGPAVIQEPTSTTVIHSDQTVEIDEYGQIVIRGESDE